MKKYFDPFDCSADVLKAMKKGILLTTNGDNKVNTMTIGWGMIGIEWGKPIFIALVRESRHTKKLLEKNGEFTVNIPVGDFDSSILGYCGSNSGSNVDKIQAMDLHLVESDQIAVPGIKEFPMTLECRVLYKQKQDLSSIPMDILEHYYPQNIDGSYPGKNRDYHIAYYAQILTSYIICE